MIAGLVLLVSSSYGAPPSKLDTLTVGSRTYTNVNILGASVTDLYFTHNAGIGNVRLKFLSPELQKQFNYDPNAAAAAEQKQLDEDKRYQGVVASSVVAQAQKALAGKAEKNSPLMSLADPISDKSLLGKRAPALEVEKWLGEKPALEGKAVLIAFWAPWSEQCQKSIPLWNQLQKAFATNLVVVGVTAEHEEKVQEMTDPKIEFASALDTKSRLSAAAAITSIPCVLLVDPAGIVRYQGHPAALTEAYLRAWLSKPTD